MNNIHLTFRIVSAVLGILVGIQQAQAEPLRIQYNAWVAFGPLLVAKEKGFFAEQGVDVHLIYIGDHTAAFAAIAAGQVDALATATQDVVTLSEPGDEPLACVLAFAESRGGDGILATKDIKSIADLKGQTVAYSYNSISQFYANVMLKEAGLSEADINYVDLPPDAAAEAFMLGEVDAAVTWEPYLTQGKDAEHGHLLADTTTRPGLLGDCLATPASTFMARKEAFQAVARAWDKAVGFVETQPTEAHQIIAQEMGDWLEDPAVVAETLTVIALYGAETNQAYFGTPERPGQIYETMQHAIDVWSDLGILKAELTPADVILHGIWD